MLEAAAHTGWPVIAEHPASFTQNIYDEHIAAVKQERAARFHGSSLRRWITLAQEKQQVLTTRLLQEVLHVEKPSAEVRHLFVYFLTRDHCIIRLIWCCLQEELVHNSVIRDAHTVGYC